MVTIIAYVISGVFFAFECGDRKSVGRERV